MQRVGKGARCVGAELLQRIRVTGPAGATGCPEALGELRVELPEVERAMHNAPLACRRWGWVAHLLERRVSHRVEPWQRGEREQRAQR